MKNIIITIAFVILGIAIYTFIIGDTGLKGAVQGTLTRTVTELGTVNP